MKKWIFSAGLLFVHSLSFAGGMRCDLNAYYSRMDISWDEQSVNVKVENPRGFKWMPQLEMPVSQASISMLEQQSAELAGLGSGFEYRWDKKKCKWGADNKWLVSCEGSGEQVGENNGVKAALFTTALINEVSLSGKQETLRLRFIFDHKSLYFVAIPFPTKFCVQKE